MTTSRLAVLAVCFLAVGIHAQAQSMPKDLPWAVAEFDGGGEWAVRFPLLVVGGWDALPDHRLSDSERTILRQRFLDDTLTSLDQRTAKARKDFDKKSLSGTLPSTEPEATQKVLADLEVARTAAREGRTEGALAPQTLGLRAVWSSGRENLPWGTQGRSDLLARSKATYVVTGSVRQVGTYLLVSATLYSDWEKAALAEWEGQFSPEEAPEKAAEVVDRFRSALLGHPWAGVAVRSKVPGSRVRVLDQWHLLPWASDELEPGTLELLIQTPGQPDEHRTVALEPGQRVQVAMDAEVASSGTMVLQTEPTGAALYLDSRYLGPSPQTIDRPLATARIRVQAPGWATKAVEIGPHSPPEALIVLEPPAPAPSVPEAKDGFYFSLAAFSASLTSSAFLGAWWSEQSNLMRSYLKAAQSDSTYFDNYKKAYDRYWNVGLAYALGVGLTSGVFVWMMIELWEYLGATQASLP